MAVTVVTDLSTTLDTRTLSWSLGTLAVGDIVVLMAQTEDFTSTLSAPTATGITFTQRQVQATSSEVYFYVYTGVVTTAGAKTVTAAWAGAGAGMHSGVAYAFPTADGYSLAATPNSAKATGTGAPSSTVTGTAGNILVCLNGDWNAVNGTSRTYRGTATEDGYAFGSGGTFYYWRQTATTGSNTYGLTAPVGQKWSLAAVEVQKSAGGTSFNGTASQTATASSAATGVVSTLGTAAQTATASTASTGATSYSGTAAQTSTASTASTGATAVSRNATATASASTAAAGTTGTAATATATASTAASGSVSGTGTATATASTAASGSVSGTGGSSPYSGFGATDPGLSYGGDDGAVDLSVSFHTTLDGQSSTGARFWIPLGGTGTLTGLQAALYAVSGGTGYPADPALATATFGTCSRGAWNEVAWSSPVALTANTVYAIVIWTPGSNYGAQGSYFTSALPAPSGAAGLVFEQSTTAHFNGTFHYSGALGATDGNFNAAWYGVDGTFAGAGTGNYTGTGAISLTATTSATGSTGTTGSGSQTATAIGAAAGATGLPGTATATATTVASAVGTVAKTGSAATTTTASGAATGTVAVTVTGGWQLDATNTGVPAGTTLTAVPGSATSGTGWTWDAANHQVVIGASGVTLSGLDIAGGVNSNNKTGWTIQNSRLRMTNCTSSLDVTPGSTITDTEIGGGATGTAFQNISGDGFCLYIGNNNGALITLRRVNMHHVGPDGIRDDGGNVLLDQCWFHMFPGDVDLGFTDGSATLHSDLLQCTNSTQTGTQEVSKCRLQGGNNDGLFIQQSGSNWNIHDSLFEGRTSGTETTSSGIGTGTHTEVPGTLTITNNRFDHTASLDQPINLGSPSPTVVRSGNVWADTLTAIPGESGSTSSAAGQTATATTAASGFTRVSASASTTGTASTTASGATLVSRTASLTTTASTTASGTVTVGVSGTASLTATASGTGSGVITVTATASPVVTASSTATGSVTGNVAASSTATVTTTASGTISSTRTASVTASITTSATGQVFGAARDITLTLTTGPDRWTVDTGTGRWAITTGAP